jgi:hypothetical protein
MKLTHISYLIRRDRTKALRHLLINILYRAVVAVAAVFVFIHGLVAIAIALVVVSYAVVKGALPATMLIADRRVTKALSGHADTVAERGQKVADEKAAAVHAHVLQNLIDAGQKPRSLVIIVINAVNRVIGGSPTVLVSIIDSDGVLRTEMADDLTSWSILRNIGSPFATATDWRASVIAAEPGKPAAAQLMDYSGSDEVTQEWDKPHDEQFLRYHPSQHPAT